MKKRIPKEELEFYRKPDSNGKLPPVGNTVDGEEATYSNTIGATELIAVWIAPIFFEVSSCPYLHKG